MSIKRFLKRPYLILLAMTVSLSGCKSVEEFAKNNQALTSVIAGGASYAACKAAGKDDDVCLVVAAAAGVITYAYLQSQMEEIQEIENVEAEPCQATDSTMEAYCVTMDSQAVKFRSGSAKISSESMGTLQQVAEVIKKSPNTLVYIEGHTDSDGAENYNQTLSEKRALSVKGVFQKQGIGADRMQALGYGESQPVADDIADPSMKVVNRRVEIRVEGGNET